MPKTMFRLPLTDKGDRSLENNLISLLGLKFNKTINKNEILIFEVLVHIRIYCELKILFGMQAEIHNLSTMMEVTMFDGVLIRKLANDLIVNEDYSVIGL